MEMLCPARTVARRGILQRKTTVVDRSGSLSKHCDSVPFRALWDDHTVPIESFDNADQIRDVVNRITEPTIAYTDSGDVLGILRRMSPTEAVGKRMLINEQKYRIVAAISVTMLQD